MHRGCVYRCVVYVQRSKRLQLPWSEGVPSAQQATRPPDKNNNPAILLAEVPARWQCSSGGQRTFLIADRAQKRPHRNVKHGSRIVEARTSVGAYCTDRQFEAKAGDQVFGPLDTASDG